MLVFKWNKYIILNLFNLRIISDDIESRGLKIFLPKFLILGFYFEKKAHFIFEVLGLREGKSLGIYN